ncbi:hypothetical protein IFR05_006558 [Cadophora sp. M221]|nr:hypothetical protein IFR05_006558 [Cadophora sp. M221]
MSTGNEKPEDVLLFESPMAKSHIREGYAIPLGIQKTIPPSQPSPVYSLDQLLNEEMALRRRHGNHSDAQLEEKLELWANLMSPSSRPPSKSLERDLSPTRPRPELDSWEFSHSPLEMYVNSPRTLPNPSLFDPGNLMSNWFIDNDGPWGHLGRTIGKDSSDNRVNTTGTDPSSHRTLKTRFSRNIQEIQDDGPDSSCRSCGKNRGKIHYHCKTCPGAGYTVCGSCADKGLSCPSTEHLLMKRVWDDRTSAFVDDKLHTISRGLHILINGQLVPGIGDTGSEETIVSATRCHEMGWKIKPSKKLMRLGNQGIMSSIGTVRIAVSFPDRPEDIVLVLAHVVKSFCFDILLGRPFLKATQTMETYIHRFKRCFFPARNRWAFYRVGETKQRLHGLMEDGNRIPFAALPDTGSRRNVMSAEWTLEQGLHLRTESENLGWITFPVSGGKATGNLTTSRAEQSDSSSFVLEQRPPDG